MARTHNPRRGSLQFWPRKRARRAYARLKNWPTSSGIKLLGFIGYKVGMTHIMFRDNRPNSLTKNQTVSAPVTIIECPPLKSLSLRFYKNSESGFKLVSEVFSEKIDKEVSRKIKIPKKKKEEIKDFDDVRLVVYSQPKLTGIKKKKPEILELAVGGENKEEKLNFLKNLMKNEIKIEEVFKEGQFLDLKVITKGKGFQGTVKRYGVKIRSHKAEKTKRGIGTLGAWTPKKVTYITPQPGKMGYHQRTEYNKLIIKMSNKADEVNPKSGFIKYGFVKNSYILIKGSVGGPRKRAVILSEPIRSKEEISPTEIISVRK